MAVRIGVGAGLALLMLTGCGGSGSPTQIQPGPGALREVMKTTLDSELSKEGAPEAEIACVDRNIADTPERVIAEEVIEPAPPHEESEAERLGRYGKGCL